ncbi:TonB-dependent siderophore receptor [Pseudoduganella violacea]|uniref:Iron complex outermembrane receptor protein/outer membrane receptor for ferric coprogen and ferric-rhodotorulic acid n=1 Tax=Pseudoduganella violacea TaxID=1715466 RepID=A0A7W5B5U5_9BURK|nr:TonB-dependent receptor [Pseudoduganella violacea]MBB3117114.1 iron complex outermembrane receptor protein/outer membrane receptor for ferric coprogen and ferric-rhodotorulic acid [Pseudoduganella violacea]
MRHRFHRSPSTPSSLAAALLCCAVPAGLLTAAPAALAQQTSAVAQTRQMYRLPAGSLDQTLNRFAAAAGIEWTANSSLTAGKTSAGLNGSYTVAEGLAELLKGHGLDAVRAPNGSYALQAVAGSTAQTAQTLPSVTVTAQLEKSATTENSGAYTSSVMTMGRGEQAMKEIPQSVSVLTRQRMDDQGITDLRQAVNNVTGVVGAQGVGPGLVVFSRGFQIDQWQYDGVPMPRNTYALGNWASEGMAFYDRMEVLRGASGLLQGTGSPGGAVNLVRKRGQAERTITLTGKAGSWDHLGAQLDAGGPLNAEGTLRGRVLLDEDRSHSYIDSVWSRAHTQYAALDYDLSSATTIGLGVSHASSRSRPQMIGLPRHADGGDIGLPRSTYTGAWWNRSQNEQSNLFFDLEHRLNERWTYKFAGIAMRESNASVHQRMAGAVDAKGNGVDYANFAVDFSSRKRGFDTYLRGQIDALALQHELIVGANYSQFNSDDAYTRTWEEGGNILNIRHDRPWQDFNSIAKLDRARTSTYDTEQKGVYSALRTKFSPALTAVVGGRLSWFKETYAAPGSSETKSESGKFTGYAGLVHALNKDWSAYASYADIFEPQAERNVAGHTLDAVTGRNYELGVKGELLQGRLNTSFAVFRYDHSGRAVQDTDAGFACDGWYCSRASGKVRSQGGEAEVSGEVARGLQLFAGYAYTTTKYLSDPENEGQIFSTWAPKHMLRVWADYKLTGALRNVSVGGGVNTQSNTLGFGRTFNVPGFSTWGARLAYQVTPEVSLALNVNNVFDKRYYIPAYSTTASNNHYGEPRSAMLTLKYTPRR